MSEPGYALPRTRITMARRPSATLAASVALALVLCAGTRAPAQNFDLNDLADTLIRQGGEIVEESVRQQHRRRDQQRPQYEPQRRQQPVYRDRGTAGTGSASAPSHAGTLNYDRAAVRETQRTLNALGYDAGPIDGVYGRRTARALRQFQRDRGLAATGDVTREGLNALRTASRQGAVATTQRPQHSGSRTGGSTYDAAAQGNSRDPVVLNRDRAAVLETQRRLNALGYDAGPIDGIYGDRTAAAIQAFGRRENVRVTGDVTEDLLFALRQIAQGQEVNLASEAAETQQSAFEDGASKAAGFEWRRVISGDSELRPLELTTYNGDPVIVRGQIYDDLREFVRYDPRPFDLWMSLAALDANPGLLNTPVNNRRAIQFAEFLTDRAKRNYFCDEFYASDGQYNEECVPDGHRHPIADGEEFWRWIGRNEFELQDSQDAFVKDFRHKLAEAGPGMPLDIVVVARVHMGRYDRERGGFDLSINGDPLEELEGKRLTRVHVGRFKLADLPWPSGLDGFLPASEAEARRLLEGESNRKIYLLAGLRVTSPSTSDGSNPTVELATELRWSELYADVRMTQPVKADGSPEMATSGDNGPPGNDSAGPQTHSLLEGSTGDLREIDVATMNGAPLVPVGFDYTDSSQSDESDQERFEKYWLPLVWLRIRPDLMDYPRYALHFAKFVREDVRQAYLGTCFGKCWAGDDEFEVEDSYKAFVQRYRGRLMNLAPSVPASAIVVSEVRLEEYDPERGGFPLDYDSSRDPVGEIRARGTGADGPSLPWPAGDLPEFWPLPEDAARKLLEENPERRLFLAVEFDITGMTEDGANFTTSENWRAVYADRKLTQPVDDFPGSAAVEDEEPDDGPAIASELKLLGHLFSETGLNAEALAPVLRENHRLDEFQLRDALESIRPDLADAIARADENNAITLSTYVRLGEYDFEKNTFPTTLDAKKFGIRGQWEPAGSKYTQIEVKSIQTDLEPLKVPQEDARKFARMGTRSLHGILRGTVVDGEANRENGTLNANELGTLCIRVQEVAVMPPDVRDLAGSPYATLSASPVPILEASSSSPYCLPSEEIQRREKETAQQAREAEEHAQERAKQRKAELEQRQAECAALKRPMDRIECKEQLYCDNSESIDPYVDASRKCNLVVSKITGARMRRRASCALDFQRLKVSSSYAPLEDTPEYDRLLSACKNAWIPNPYGPEMIDLQLGMERSDAERVVRNRIWTDGALSMEILEEKAKKPFDRAELFVTEDGGHGIALFFYEKRLAGIGRRLYFGQARPAPGDVIQKMREAYGAETWADGERAFLWTFSDDAGKNCAKLVKRVEPRKGWSGGSWTVEEPARDGDNAPVERRPVMIGPTGSPDQYAKLRSCGPVLIGEFSIDEEGQVANASFVLFDPGWMASLPPYAFKGWGEKEQHDEASVEIDF